MRTAGRFAGLIGLLALAACVVGPTTSGAPWRGNAPGWTPAAGSTRAVGLGLPGGAVLAEGVAFAGGVEIVLDTDSPLHSLSDLKLIGEDGFVAVTDAGDLVRGRLRLDRSGRLTGVDDLRLHRLTLRDGSPIVDKADGDAEGLALTGGGDLLVSFERDHRIWNYGRPDAPSARPAPAAMPDFAFASNDGMEALAASDLGWAVAGESGGLWDCNPGGCLTRQAPPATPLTDREYRITGMDQNPFGAGWFVVQRAFTPPVDARARVRRMREDGALGPVLVELKLPGLTDNFEGIAVRQRDDGVRLYILSDDNSSERQRTLLLAFDVRPVR